ncbi:MULTISPECIES: CoA-binding protein [Brevibacillus]|jgi:succinyl-CoA synthetase alpha subunit|uniref:succinate--CoA ligase subunit alpha n=1 Tax=Brevibacillus TaxID=55080 RepID=UPI000E385DA0|nr:MULTISPECIES: CoA-binding protein [Brevibacillus]MBR8659075.1 CoA-binding protein [Brevibacillus sp. NL20B1]MDT3417052.1 succinyl-CoA synthetase alpha subunit [Brevibacillus aydinogluensis]NNV02956.1 succinate--CoA ligase subunit alpha [Brevibacillus sp. MCWH]REK62680.1 MAG: succinate--CoA ligase subunit alpha [Brevibacillus sp.]
MAILIDKRSRIVIQGITGREATMVTRHTLDYGTNVVAGVTPGKKGQHVHGVPVYNTVREAVDAHQADTSLVVVPPAFALDAVREAIDNGIKVIVVTTENIPQLDTVKMLHLARQNGVRIIGPNTVGMINPKDRVKLGSIGGDNPDRCFVPGHVGVISRSGGMTAETSWMVKRAGFGVSTSVGIGGDALIGTTIRDLLELFERDPDTHAVVTFSEPGTTFEEEAAEFVKSGGFRKPLISFIAGRFTERMPEGTVFGHAGALISGNVGRPSGKAQKLREAGAHVVERYDDLIEVLQSVLAAKEAK